MLEMDA
jgi:hypothetical protein